MHYYIENKSTGTVLGIYEAGSESDAIEAMAQDAGYDTAADMPGSIDPDLVVEEAEEECSFCGRSGLYSPDPETWDSDLSHDDQGRIVCTACAVKRGLL
jgi:hypothetical protein